MLASLLLIVPLASEANSVEIPTSYRADRFLVEVPLAKGKRPLLLADTGGAMLIFRDSATEAGSEMSESEIRGRKTQLASLPPLKEGANFPLWTSLEGKLTVWNRTEAIPLQGDEAGILGMDWFTGRSWTFDYPKKRLLFLTGEVSKPAGANEEPLGPNPMQPRVQVEVEGQKIVCILDTGASTRLTAGALETIKDGGPAVRGTSFIVAKHFDRWRNDHPEWPFIGDAERNFGQPYPMIRVPKVKIAGFEVGPVWFIRRDDESFKMVSGSYKPQLEGAIGGNVLRSFRITLDYMKGVSYYEKP